MATRDDLYRQFGPKLIEALALAIMDEINALRQQHSLADRTAGQLINAISTKLQGLADFEGMNNQ